MTAEFIPVSREDMLARGIEELDFVFISGDAYVDHPSFSTAIICRLLESRGYKVGIIAQPNWRNDEDFLKLGKPRLAFLVSAGNMDSLINRYTAAKKLRSTDAYSPGGEAGLRPERATIVYTSKLRKLYKDVPIIIGGIEASLRRMAHYDYWSDSFRRSVLADSQADMLIYGMGERAIIKIAADLQQGVAIQNIVDVAGTCFRVPTKEYTWDYLELPSYESILKDRKLYAKAFRLEYLEQDFAKGRRLIQQNGEWCIVQNPPAAPLTEEEMDEVYDLPYVRTWHPMYDKVGGVPALEEVEFSLVSQRGCFGGCNFCAIISHEGRIIQSRSQKSLMREAKILTKQPRFKGYIHDVGGPTANFRIPSCEGQFERGTCRNRQCLSPKPCPNLEADHTDYIRLLKKLRRLPSVKKVFVRSGLRFDYMLLADKNDELLRELCQHHISGRLKIAPEHIADCVTMLMGKTERAVYMEFVKRFERINREYGKKQYLVPYFMSSHPGATIKEAIELAEFLRDMRYRPQQVQDFIPTPGTLSTCIYYSGLHPLTNEKIYTAKSYEEKKEQRALLQYWMPKNASIVRRTLRKAGREDLIGYGKGKLITPEPTAKAIARAKEKRR